MRSLMLITILISITLISARASDQVLLFNEASESKEMIITDEQKLAELINNQNSDDSVDLELSTLLFFNRVGINYRKEIINNVEIGVSAGVYFGIIGLDADVGITSRVYVADMGEGDVYIQGGAYRILRASYKGLEDDNVFNSARLGVGYKNKKSTRYHEFTLQYIDLDDENVNTDRDSSVIPMYTFGQRFEGL